MSVATIYRVAQKKWTTMQSVNIIYMIGFVLVECTADARDKIRRWWRI